MSDTKKQHKERQAQQPTNLHTCRNKTTRELSAESSSEQQENSGAVTAAAEAAAGGVEDRESDGISGSRMGCEDGSELPDETDFPYAGHDMADYIKTGDNDTAIEEKMHGDLQTSENDHYNNSPHTQHSNETASNNNSTLYLKTQQRRNPWKNCSAQRSAKGYHGGHPEI
jgi:hypothetical protein